MKKVEWRSDVRPSQEEAEFGINGMRADHNGARLEVRVLSSTEEGLHVAWKVGRPYGELSAKGVVNFMDPLIGNLALDEEISKDQTKRALQKAFDWAKKRATLIAEAWVAPQFKLGKI